MKTPIEVKIQSVSLAHAKGSFETKRLLSKAIPARNQLYVSRDGYLIRYSSQTAATIGIEPLIAAIKSDVDAALSNEDGASRKLKAESSFHVVEDKGDKLWVIRVHNWIPSQIYVTEATQKIAHIFSSGIVYGDLLDQTIEKHELNTDSLRPVPSFKVSRKHVTKNFDKEKRYAIMGGGAIGGITILALLVQLLFTGDDAPAPLRRVSNQPVIEQEVDFYKQFREYQESRTTVGRTLAALEAMYMTVRDGELPTNWQSSEISIEGNRLEATFLPSGSQIGKIQDLKKHFANHHNRQFVTIDGQKADMVVHLSNDGAGYGNVKASTDVIRDPIIDSLSDLGAAAIHTSPAQRHGNYQTQRLKVEFRSKSPLHLGTLSRLFANKPIYTHTGKLTHQGGVLSLELEMIFVMKG
ncbi:hypothetical protein [Vibrio agarivorans]|uniref:Uncharacterized protein n=1 Tax=Vibrio agarivorans TaxID=153622 RepID=A0ABT7Y7D9_9VIBR|nr:hypothetical protein [Vibrio agarivorans]MDN2483967.1 hypothetical protein [Vibrio agarivorans]